MLKPFADLTQDELVALTDETIQFYIDVACAEAGVKLLPPTAPVEPKLQKPEYDLLVYDVGGIIVSNRDTAGTIADAINEHRNALLTLNYMSGPSFEKKASPRSEPVAVTPVSVYSEHRGAMIGTALAAYDRAKKAYQDAVREYDEIGRARRRIADDINQAVEAAHDRAERQTTRRTLYARYLELANNDRVIAARFLYRAYPDSVDLVPDLFEGVILEPSDKPFPLAPVAVAVPVAAADDIPY